MQSLPDWLQSTIVIKAAWSVIVVVTLWAIRRVALSVVLKRTEDPRLRYRWQKTSRYISFALGALFIGAIWSAAVQSLGTFLGLLSAGLAIALKDLVVNFAGWGFILWRRPFEVGDRIQLGEHRGDVIDIRIFQFSLMEIGNWVHAEQSTGRIIHVPNGKVMTDVLANYSKGFRYIWNEIPVLITFESNWEAAKKILTDVIEEQGEQLTKAAEDALRKVSAQFLIFYSNLTPIVYTSVVDSGVLLTIRHLCDARRRRGVSEKIWEGILREFAGRDDIDFAYPTTRFYNNRTEGKEGARAEAPGIVPNRVE